ncbi:MAG: hypothetical protein KAI44_00330 [Methylococcales bacterium]|nr:hypothetical protein [Methylococcales bacterium]
MHDPFSIAHFGIKSSPHRPFMSMQTSSRLYQCHRCHAPVVICHRCDHGQRYCAKGCSKKARIASQKRASKKYQATRAGRFNNAARQQRFRVRQKQKVTHHCSFQIPPHDVLSKQLKTPKSPMPHQKQTKIIHCHHCGEVCSPFLRHDFLRHRVDQGNLRW